MLASLVGAGLPFGVGACPPARRQQRRLRRLQRRMLAGLHNWTRRPGESMPQWCRRRNRDIRDAIASLGPLGRWDRAALHRALKWVGHATRLSSGHPLGDFLRAAPHREWMPNFRGRPRYREHGRGSWRLRLLRAPEVCAQWAWQACLPDISEFMLARPAGWQGLAQHRELWRAVLRRYVESLH